MVRDLMVLPDGSEIFSGNTMPAVKTVTLTQRVNRETELTLGSVCPAMVQLQILAPKGTLQLQAGTEFTLYRVDSQGQRHKEGIFTAETPVLAGENCYSVTGYDRVAKLDKDLSGWLESLEDWPYRALDLARMVAESCGLTLKTETFLNENHRIHKFSGQGITGRMVMAWLGQLCARFCRATADGEIEFAWYEKVHNISLVPQAYSVEGSGYTAELAGDGLAIASKAVRAEDDGAGNMTVTGLVVTADDGDGRLSLGVDDGSRTGISSFMGGLACSDYETAPLGGVCIRLTEEDVGVCYPQNGDNPYVITGNYLLTGGDLLSVAKGIYGAIAGVRYTPCKVSLPAGSGLSAGDVVQITDSGGKTVTAYIMTKTRKDQKETLECTGSPRRDTATAVNNLQMQAVSGKVFTLSKSVDALTLELSHQISQTDRRFAQVTLEADRLQSSVTALQTETGQNGSRIDGVMQNVTQVQQTAEQLSSSVSALWTEQDQNAHETELVKQNVAQVQQTAEQLSSSVSALRAEQDQNAHGMELVKENVTKVEQTAAGVTVQVQQILDNGVSRVTTGMGYTFDEKGLQIQKSGEEIGNLLDNTGMYVTRSGEVILRADAAGVVAADVKVDNFLVVGEHARFEDYSSGEDKRRTACFWV